MSNAEIKNIALAFNELFKSTKRFGEAREEIEGKKTNDSFEKSEVEKIKKEYDSHLMGLEKFERELDKFEKFLPPEVYAQLKVALGSEKEILSSISKDATSYLELNDDTYLNSIVENFDKELGARTAFAKELRTFSNALGFSILKQAIDEKISLEDLKMMAVMFEGENELCDRIKFTIDYLERREKEKQVEETKEKTEEQGNEVNTQGNNEVGSGKISPQELEPEPPKPTLQEKIDNINYQQGMNLNAEVQDLTVDAALATVQAQIAALEGKKKRTIKETFQLRQLKEQELGFQAYKESLEEQKLSGKEQQRNKKLESNLGKIVTKEMELKEAIAQSQNYTSKTLRFFSARYQQKLVEQLKVLKDKQGSLTDMQKYSAVARFDKESKKIIRRARRKGTIEQLKQFRDSIVDEIQNIGEDFVRFSSTREEDLPVLNQSTVVIPDNIISLDEHRAQLEQSKVM